MSPRLRKDAHFEPGHSPQVPFMELPKVRVPDFWIALSSLNQPLGLSFKTNKQEVLTS